MCQVLYDVFNLILQNCTTLLTYKFGGSMLTEAERKFYNTNGYLLVKNLLEDKYIDVMFSTVANLLTHFGGEVMESYNNFNSWDDENLNEAMILLRKQGQKRFSAIFESVRSSLALNNLCSCQRVTDYVSDILNAKPDCLSYQTFFLRMDTPF